LGTVLLPICAVEARFKLLGIAFQVLHRLFNVLVGNSTLAPGEGAAQVMTIATTIMNV
jgi:hypothetical protein